MDDDAAVEQPPRPTVAGATIWLALGSAVNGLAVFGLQVVGTRALGPVEYAPIGVLWTLQYLWIAVVVTAVEAYVTRLATLEGLGGAQLRRFLRLFTPWLVAATVLTVGIGWLLRAPLFAGIDDLAIVLGLVVLGYGWYATARGRMAGSGRFHAYAVATTAESVLRLVAAVLVLAAVTSTRALAWAFPVGPLLVVIGAWRYLSRDPSPTSLTAPTALDVDRGRQRAGRRFLAATSTANASVQFLLAGGPLILLPLGADAATVSVFFTTITAARVPMTFALNGGLSRLLPPLTRLSEARDAVGLHRATLRLVGAIVVTASVAAGTAGLIGPDVIGLVFGADFRPTAPFVAIVAVGTVLAVGGLLLDQVYIATAQEGRLPVTWLGAVALAGVLVLSLPGAPELRVAGAFSLATAAAVAALSIPLLRAGRP